MNNLFWSNLPSNSFYRGATKLFEWKMHLLQCNLGPWPHRFPAWLNHGFWKVAWIFLTKYREEAQLKVGSLTDLFHSTEQGKWLCLLPVLQDIMAHPSGMGERCGFLLIACTFPWEHKGGSLVTLQHSKISKCGRHTWISTLGYTSWAVYSMW